MKYHAVGNRCAVNLKSLQLPISDEEALAILIAKGFKLVEVDIIALARQCIKSSEYRRGAKPSEAPTIVDCSSFIKYLYGERGIWLPRRSIQQRELGVAVSLEEVSEGDVVFISGWVDYYHNDPSDGVGHVGIATGEETIVHAADKKAHVIESSLESFVGKTKFRGIRRYVPNNQAVLTFETPPDREVEIDDDLRWIVLQSIPKR